MCIDKRDVEESKEYRQPVASSTLIYGVVHVMRWAISSWPVDVDFRAVPLPYRASHPRGSYHSLTHIRLRRGARVWRVILKGCNPKPTTKIALNRLGAANPRIGDGMKIER